MASASDRLEVLERLAAGAAALQRLAGGRRRRRRGARCRGSRSAGRRAAATAARHEAERRARRRRSTRPGRRDAVVAQLAPALGADPVGRPGRRAPHADARRAEAGGVERGDDARLDHLGRRAAGVGRRDDDLERVAVARSRRARCRGRDRDDRHLGIEHGREHRPGVLDARAAGGAHAAPAAACRTRRRLTTRRPGSGAADAASRPACSRGARCARPRLPVLRKARSAGQRQAGLGEHGGERRRASRRAGRPSAGRGRAAAASSSTASVSNISAMYGQSRSSAAFRRAADSSVPSPRRTTQSAACSRW